MLYNDYKANTFLSVTIDMSYPLNIPLSEIV